MTNSKKQSRTVILSPGHGTLVNGIYTTKGKQSPNWDKGILYEGAFNRWIINQLIQELDYEGIPYYHAFPELNEVTPLTTLNVKKNRANRIYKKDRSVYMLEIHANAGGGTGMEGFTSKGETDADPIGELFLINLSMDLEKHILRKDLRDGDLDKEAGYYILRKTNCPTFLFEVGFMDYKPDYDKLWCREFQRDVVMSLKNTIIKLYKGDY